MSTNIRSFAARLALLAAVLAVVVAVGAQASTKKEVEYWGNATQATRPGFADPGAAARFAARAGVNDRGASVRYDAV
jgi:hypothetical protein